MRRRERTLAALLRALIACMVLLFAAPGAGVAAAPLRDVSAWVALGRVAAPAPASAAPALRAGRCEPRRLAPAAAGLALAQLKPERPPPVAAAAGDQRYLYLDLQTLRC